jgi:hypothetical protein
MRIVKFFLILFLATTSVYAEGDIYPGVTVLITKRDGDQVGYDLGRVAEVFEAGYARVILTRVLHRETQVLPFSRLAVPVLRLDSLYRGTHLMFRDAGVKYTGTVSDLFSNRIVQLTVAINGYSLLFYRYVDDFYRDQNN